MNECKNVLIDFCCYFLLLLGGMKRDRERERRGRMEKFSVRKFILEISDVVCREGMRSMLMNFKLYAKICTESEKGIELLLLLSK